MIKNRLANFLNRMKGKEKVRSFTLENQRRKYIPTAKEWKDFLEFIRSKEITEDQVEQLVVALGDKDKVFLEQEKQEKMQIEANYASEIRMMHPKITANELQICCYIIQGKSSLEIANLMGIEVSTVTSYRSRLRTKLGIKRGRSLKVYLDSITRMKKICYNKANCEKVNRGIVL